ncbi:MAG: RagB/SusD family nutrient uptake outer membrane protein [Butyricimonas faecihominis]
MYIGTVCKCHRPVRGYMEGGYYNSIRYCNAFVSHIGATHNMEDHEKLEWTAEIKALKAFLYFDLVRHYGPIVLVDENIPMNVPVTEMRQPRVHVDTCIQEIVRLLDEALVDLLPASEKDASRQGYFCKEAALMLKAQALVLAASPLTE